jgi:hypothetical protein
MSFHCLPRIEIICMLFSCIFCFKAGCKILVSSVLIHFAEKVTLTDNEDDLIETAVGNANDSDDLVQFMKSLGLKGVTGLLELTIAGIPAVHVAVPGNAKLFVC